MLDENSRHVVTTFKSSATPWVNLILGLVVRCCYRDDRVMRSLDMEPCAPLLDGFDLEKGDWSLLDPARQRARFFREVLESD